MPSLTTTLAALTAAIALVPLVSSQSVYVPGDAENAPGASVQEIGVGADGFTSYLVNGVTIAADATNVIATEIGQAGAVVYNCAIGADAQATCSISQVYDGATYGYTEPVSYFGNAAQATPPAGPSPPTTAVDPAATSTLVSSTIAPASTTSAPASSSIASTTSAASTSSGSSQNNNAGPQANQPQQTSANVFGANSGALKGASSAGSILAGCAAIAMVYFAL